MNNFKNKLAEFAPSAPRRTYSAGFGSDDAPTRATPPVPNKPKSDGLMKLPFPKVNKGQAAKKGFELMVDNTTVTKSETSHRPEVRVFGSKVNGSLIDFDPISSPTKKSYGSFDDSGWSGNDAWSSKSNPGFTMTPTAHNNNKPGESKNTSLLDLAGLDFRPNDPVSNQFKPPAPRKPSLVKPLAPQPSGPPAVPPHAKPTSVITTVTTENKGGVKITKTVTKTTTVGRGRLPNSSSTPDFSQPQKPTVIRPPPKPNRPSGMTSRLDNASKSYLSTANGLDHGHKKKKKAPPRPKSGPPRPMKPPKHAVHRPSLPENRVVEDRAHGRVLYVYHPSQPDELTLPREGEIVYLERQVDENWLFGRIGTSSGLFPANHIEIIKPIKDQSADHPLDVHKELNHPDRLDKPDRPELGSRCRALYDFPGESPDDLSFEAGDVFKLLERVSDDWMKGVHRGSVGIFPAAFVDIIEDLPVNGAQTDVWGDTGEESESSDVVRVRALYDFEGTTGELSFKIPANLPIYTGSSTSTSERSLCSQNSTTSPTSVTSDVHSSTSGGLDSHQDGPHCIAIYDFHSQQDGDLAFSAGDVISLSSRLGDDWLIGSRADGQSGMFPLSFVRVVVDLPEEADETFDAKTPDFGPPPPVPESSGRDALPSNSEIPQARALYDYQGQTELQLSFKAGDLIVLLERLDENWMMGELDGDIGQVADCYLQIITPLSP